MKKKFKLFIIIFTIFTFFCASSASVFIYISLNNLPEIKFMPLENIPKSEILDENKKVVEVFGETKNEYVTYEEIPPILINALLSIEDINFFSHNGVDFKRTFKAFIHNLTSPYKQGGSTITQQLIKNT